MTARLYLASALALTAALASPGAQAQPSGRPDAPPAPKISPALISRADALKLVVAAIDACNAIGEHPTATVFDADGYQRAMLSDDLGPIVGIPSSARKAATVVAFKVPSSQAAARIKADPAFAAQYAKDPRYAFGPGAVPLYRDGKFVGALALGGGHDKDERCAMAAIKGTPWAGPAAAR